LQQSKYFITKLSNYLKQNCCRNKFKGDLKSNLIRTAQKIEEMNSPYKITDLIRGEIKVNHKDDIKEIYLHLSKLPAKQFNIIKIDNKIKSDIIHISINFIWDS